MISGVPGQGQAIYDKAMNVFWRAEKVRPRVDFL